MEQKGKEHTPTRNDMASLALRYNGALLRARAIGVNENVGRISENVTA